MKIIQSIMILMLMFFVNCSNPINPSDVTDTTSLQGDSTTLKTITLANSAYSLGEYQKAIDLLTSITDTNKINIDKYWYVLGKSQYKLSIPEAYNSFKYLLDNFPTSVYITNSNYFLGRISQKNLDLKNANIYFTNFFASDTVKNSSFYDDGIYFYGTLNYDLKNYSASKNLLYYFYSTYTNSIKLLNAQYCLARSYDKLNIDDSAQINYKNLITNAPTDTFLYVNSLYYNAIIDYTNNLYSISKAAFNTIINQYPNTYHYSDALFYFAKCNYNDSTISKIDNIADFQKVIDLTNDTMRIADAQYYIGKCYYYATIPNYNKALTIFENIEKSFPNDTARVHDAIYWQGRTQYMIALNSTDSILKISRYNTSKNILTNYLNLNTTDTSKIVDAKYRIGVIDYFFGDYNNALSQFNDIINNFSNSYRIENATYYKGKTYYKQNDYNGSITILQSLIDNYPNSTLISNAHFYIGLDNYYIPDYNQATSNLQLIINSFPQSSKYPDALYWLGKSLYQQADYTNAKIYFTEYVNNYPTGFYYQNAQNYITKCNTQLGI